MGWFLRAQQGFLYSHRRLTHVPIPSHRLPAIFQVNLLQYSTCGSKIPLLWNKVHWCSDEVNALRVSHMYSSSHFFDF